MSTNMITKLKSKDQTGKSISMTLPAKQSDKSQVKVNDASTDKSDHTLHVNTKNINNNTNAMHHIVSEKKGSKKSLEQVQKTKEALQKKIQTGLRKKTLSTASVGSILNWGREKTNKKKHHQFGKNPPKDYEILRADFMKTLRKRGYFLNLSKESPEYQAKLKQAEKKFALRHGWRLNVHSMDQSNTDMDTSNSSIARTERMYRSFNHAFKKSKVSSPRMGSGTGANGSSKSTSMSMPLQPQRQKMFSQFLSQDLEQKFDASIKSTINDEMLLPTLLAPPDENKRKSPRNSGVHSGYFDADAVLNVNESNDVGSMAGQKRGIPAISNDSLSSSPKNTSNSSNSINSLADKADHTSSSSSSSSSSSGSGSDSDSDSDFNGNSNSDSGSSSIDEDNSSRISIPGLHQVHPNFTIKTPTSKRKSGLNKWLGTNVESRVNRSGDNYNTSIKDFLQGNKPAFDWRLGDQIGSGAHGIVYRGLNQHTGALIAIKQIPIDNIEEIQIAIVLQREVDILTNISHPNIVKYFGMEVRNNFLHLITEYVSGGSIADQLQQFGPMKESLVQRHTYQILVGLAFLHNHGVVHRDIKGQNVLVSQKGRLKLADFGAAQTFDGIGSNGSQRHALCGTPAFVAPEIILETGHDDRADIWSLGCTVVQMLTAQTPWSPLEFGSLYELLHYVAHGSTSSTGPPCSVPITPTLRDFLSLCFERDKTHRPSAKDLLQHVLLSSFQTTLHKENDIKHNGSATIDNVKVSPCSSISSTSEMITPEKIVSGNNNKNLGTSPDQLSPGLRDEDLVGLNVNQFDDVGPGSEIEVGLGCCSCFHQLPSKKTGVPTSDRHGYGSGSGSGSISMTKTRIVSSSTAKVVRARSLEETEATYATGLKARRKRQGGSGSSRKKCIVC
jgi:serine/threonine protein kinase